MQGKIKEQSFHILRKWAFFEVILPLFFIVALYWPIRFFVCSIPFSFEKVFASSDLLPISALLLLGVSTELEHDRLFSKLKSNALENFRFLSMTLSIIFLSLYGFCKLRYIQYQFPVRGGQIDEQITNIAFFSIIVVCFSVLLAASAKLTSIHKKIKLLAQ